MSLYYAQTGGIDHEAACDRDGCNEKVVADGRMRVEELICYLMDDGWVFLEGRLYCKEHGVPGWRGGPK